AYGPQNDVTLKMPAFEWVHVQLHQQKGMISLSPPTICNSAINISSIVFASMITIIHHENVICAEKYPLTALLCFITVRITDRF
ncbi:hypothetical protein, partial [Escherichia coli]|uniref:hypothetical protein n=1 Tax=Escherichia coli TaxID=562 RepID=UPI001BDC7C8D